MPQDADTERRMTAGELLRSLWGYSRIVPPSCYDEDVAKINQFALAARAAVDAHGDLGT